MAAPALVQKWLRGRRHAYLTACPRRVKITRRPQASWLMGLTEKVDSTIVPTPSFLASGAKMKALLVLLLAVASGCSFGREKIPAGHEEESARDSAYETGSPIEHE